MSVSRFVRQNAARGATTLAVASSALCASMQIDR